MRCHPDRFTCEVCGKPGLTRQGFVHFYKEGKSLMRHPDCDFQTSLEEQAAMARRALKPT